MCGIVGALGAKLDAALLERLFIATEPRGKEATGFYFPSQGINKDAFPVSTFLEAWKEQFLEGTENDNIFVGHCRLATHGEPEYIPNNHPIESENWIIVHNGVVSLKDIENYPYKSDTDTENILAYVEKYGLEQGLTYVTSGAAVILVPKHEDNTFYLFKTSTADMLIAYDMDNETMYVCSGERYMKAALDPLSEKPERLGGLFSIADRRLKVTEPKARDLWKVSLKDGLIHSEMVKGLSAVYSHQNNDWNQQRNFNRRYACGYTGDWEYDDRWDDEFVPLGTGNNRPSVLDGTVKSAKIIKAERKALEEARKHNQARTTNGSTNNHSMCNNGGTKNQSLVKGNGHLSKMLNSTLVKGDIVEIVREIQSTDPVYATNGGLIANLLQGTMLVVKKELEKMRFAVENKQGDLFSVPRSLIELTDNPNCYGISYTTLSSYCTHNCMWADECKTLCFETTEEDLPMCAGTYEDGDDDCMNCWYVAKCLQLMDTIGELDGVEDDEQEHAHEEND